jgi:A/G-specific adenine glycosylase
MASSENDLTVPMLEPVLQLHETEVTSNKVVVLGEKMPAASSAARAPKRGRPKAAVADAADPTAAQRLWFADQLLGWYRKAQRDLPWRRIRDPYAIWVSEIMLQQTQVATVLDYYQRWMRRFPTLQRLAEAAESDVLHAWQGLGYYSRARNLQRAAQQVVSEHDGKLPRDVEGLQQLPGIGRYSAGAIVSSAFEITAPIVDGNVTRLLCRFFGLYGDTRKNPLKDRLWQLAEQLIPPGRVRDFNQALMEMGATCCTPKRPLCQQCPLAAQCHARRHDAVSALPQPPVRPKVTDERHIALLAHHRGRYLLEQRPSDAARWAGLWSFPNAALAQDETPQRGLQRLAKAAGVKIVGEELLTSLTHSITRYRIELSAHRCAVKALPSKKSQSQRWVSPADLHRYALPSPHARIADSLRANTES